MRAMEYQRRLLPAFGGVPGSIVYGGGSSGPPQQPDYSQYISAMTGIGNTLSGYGNDLYNWATTQGQNLGTLASTVANRAGTLASSAVNAGTGLVSNWMNTYGPLYNAQAARAQQVEGDMPNTENQWAGTYGAAAGQAFDASAASLKRQLQGYGLSEPSVGTAAIDAATSNQRALAVTASSQQGRLAAMGYGDTLTNTALATGTQIPTVGAGQENVGLAGGNQQVNAPESAVSTTAGAYAPSISYSNSAFPYMNQWGSTMSNSYNQALQAYQIGSQTSSGWGALAGTALGGAAQLGASYLGGVGFGNALGAAGGVGGAMSAGGGSMGPMTAGLMLAEEGGAIKTNYVGAGAVVPAAASPSGGAQTDDVVVPVNGGAPASPQKAAINVGEFIWPKDVVAWKGEEWMQKEIAKARQGMKTHTIAKPEMAPASAIQMRPPMHMQGAPA